MASSKSNQTSVSESVSSTDDDDEAFRKKKKPRTAFSREQVAELEKKFNEKKYLSSAERGELAEKLKLSDMQVKTWFQNRRMKFKRQTEEAEMELKSPKYPYGPFVSYPSLYGYMPYKTDAAANLYGQTNGPHSCSYQYSTTMNHLESFNGGYVNSNPTGMTSNSTQHHRGCVNGGTFFNRGGVSPLSSPTTPVTTYASNHYFNGDYGVAPSYSD